MTNTQTRVNLFFDLATLISAGISASQAAKKVYTSYPEVRQWSIAISALEKGSCVSRALTKANLINRYQAELISAYEDVGHLEQALRILAKQINDRDKRKSLLRSKLLYPMAILVVGILVSSIVSLVQNPQSSLVFLFLLLTAKVLFAFWIFKTILTYSQKGSEFWLSKLDRYQNSAWYKQHFQSLLFEVLFWHSSSGIEPKTSFSRISKLINSLAIKKKLLKVSNLCGQGIGISTAIRQAELPLTSAALQVFSAGEYAGDIEGTLKKQLEIMQFESNLAIDNLMEWIPRFFYGLAVVFAISALI